jgi:hypothetical protein
MSASRTDLARMALEGLRPAERRALLRDFLESPRPTAQALEEKAILVTQKEASRFLGVSRQTMFRWGVAGVVSPVVISGVRRFRRSDLEQLARTGTGGAE